MVRRWHRKPSILSLKRVISNFTIFPFKHEFSGRIFKPNSPVESCSLLIFPIISTKVVNNIAASDNQHPLVPKRLKKPADLIMKLWSLSFINAELNNRNICIRIEMAQHCPHAMVKTPVSIKTHIIRQKDLPHTLRKFRTPRGRPAHLKQFSGKSVKIMDGFGRNAS